MNATDTVELRLRAVKVLREAVAGGSDLGDLARKYGAKPEALGRWLAGQNLPRLHMAKKILRASGGG